MMLIQKALITGPTGVVGTALVDELVSCGVEVFCVCHRGSKRIGNIRKDERVHIVECDVDELSNLPNLIKGPVDVFYHLAWAGGTYGKSRDDVEGNAQNIKYTIDALKTAKELGCKAFVGAGSQSEYGNSNEVRSSSTLPSPESMYAASKLSSMYIGRLYAKQLGIRFCWCRIFSVFGIHDGEQTMIMSTIRKMLAGQECDFTKGEQLWDYIYSKDCAQALRLVGERGEDQRIYNIASGDTRYLYEYITSLHELVNPESKINIGAIPYYEHQAMNLTADIAPLLACGFKPRYTFEDGVKELLETIKKEKKNA